jgi:hypothetical protein
MKKTRTAGFLALTVATILATLFALAQPASAAVRDWVPAVSYGPNWHCTQNVQPHYVIDTCLINSHNGDEPVYRAVMVVHNILTVRTDLRATKINTWSLPSPAKQIRDDGCVDAFLVGMKYAGCFGTPVTRSQLCSIRPGARSVTANGAINLPFETQERITVVSPPVAVVC